MPRLIKMPPSWLNRFVFGLNRFRSSNTPSICGQPLKVELGKTGNWKGSLSLSLCFENGSLAFHFPFEIRTHVKMAVPLAQACPLSHAWKQWLLLLSLLTALLLPSAAVDFSVNPLPFHPIRNPTTATHRPPRQPPCSTFRFDCHDFQLLPLSCLLSIWPQRG